MPRTRSITILVATITIFAAIIFVLTYVRAVWLAPEQEVPAPTLAAAAPENHSPSSALPERLIIPAINVNAFVQKVGIKKDGSMGTPNNFTDVAWYKYGPLPGQIGSAVIDGHVDNGLGLDGVFKHLQNIAVGDNVYVEDASSTIERFVVQDIEIYPYQSVPLDQVFTQHDRARLNLITCEGTWVPLGKTYDHRIVVYTIYKGVVPSGEPLATSTPA